MAKPIMIQGTASSVGKSLICAGLCRIFAQDGYRVAPFKSQNMALNSFITKEGLEMGRAQVMQAEAAGVEPSVLMNPILLKPTSDTGSQVIVRGEVMGVLDAAAYFAYREQLRPLVRQAYQELAAGSDIMVIEGAGSPAEINLREGDIVNMGMAALADAPVLLAGDIDRGGVFASLYGTVALLKDEERQRIRGLIINKFRGDPQILRPGLAMLEDLTKAPVLGVIPYLQLDLDDEDSLSDRLTEKQPAGAEPLDIAVIRLPHIANFTDFNALSREPTIGLRYVEKPSALAAPDLILLPGSKNTMGDLAWLYANGLATAIQERAAQGTLVMGICGGYQMLGMTLLDPDGVEEGGRMIGLELLPVDTVFEPHKRRSRVAGSVLPQSNAYAALSGAGFTGYEIHMGRSALRAGATPLIRLSDGSQDGCATGNVCGSYVHGLFDEDLGRALTRLLLRRKGLPESGDAPLGAAQYKERQYDALAAALRDSLDLAKIYRIMGVAR